MLSQAPMSMPKEQSNNESRGYSGILRTTIGRYRPVTSLIAELDLCLRFSASASVLPLSRIVQSSSQQTSERIILC